MPAVINVVAAEDSNAIRDLTSAPTSDASIAQAFAYAERGVFGDPPHSRTSQNGGWSGVLSIARDANGTAQAQRTWTLTDAQVAASGLTSAAAMQAFTQRLADDVHQSLYDRASRVTGPHGDHWRVGASASMTSAATPAATPITVTLPGLPAAIPPLPGITINHVTPESSNVGWWALGIAAAVGVVAWVVYGDDK